MELISLTSTITPVQTLLGTISTAYGANGSNTEFDSTITTSKELASAASLIFLLTSGLFEDTL